MDSGRPLFGISRLLKVLMPRLSRRSRKRSFLEPRASFLDP
jgi:hypothetical protein